VFALDERFMDAAYAEAVIEECHHAWEQLISGEKERMIENQSDDVKDLVRNLSKNSLFNLAQQFDEHEEMRSSDFGEEDSDALFF
jgi:inorganic pyrophosphatase